MSVRDNRSCKSEEGVVFPDIPLQGITGQAIDEPVGNTEYVCSWGRIQKSPVNGSRCLAEKMHG